MSAPAPSDCARTAAVLALHLDGDIGTDDAEESGFDFVCPDTLVTHLADCDACAVALRRARRLDAILAETAGRSTAAESSSGAAIDRLFATVAERAAAEAAVAEPAPAARRARADEARPLRADALAPAALMVGLFALLVTSWGLLQVLTRSPAAAAVHAVARAGAPTPVVTEVMAPEVESSVTDAEPDEAVGIRLADDAMRVRPRAAERSREVGPEALLARFEDAALPRPERLAALTALLQVPGSSSERPRALRLLTRALAAGSTDAELLTDALAVASADAAYTAFLHGTLSRGGARVADGDGPDDDEELAALVVATRLGGSRLDAAVRRGARCRPAVTVAVASAVRQSTRRCGSAALLLELWNDLATRGPIDEDRTAHELFAGQPAPVLAEVVTELGSARSVTKRVRCLLALGSSSDRQATAPLLEWAARGCRRETYAAAWSLGQLPHEWLDEAARRAARDRGAFVLRAALARARLPAAAVWTGPLGLAERERAELLTASFDRFPRCAEWFRDGPTVRLADPAIAED